MKLALYYPWVYLHGGPERTIVELLKRSRHEWVILTNRYEPDATFPSLRSASIIELRRVPVKRSFLRVGAAALNIGTQKLPVDGYDGLVVFCEGLGDLVLLRRPALPVVCLCFTPLRAALDPHYQRAYLATNPGRWWRAPALGLSAAAFRILDRRLWRRYAGVIAISDEVRKRIAAGRLYPPDRVRLLYPGVDLDQFPPSPPRGKSFVIPGRIMWTKNLELAIDAFRTFQLRRPEHRGFVLTLAGYVDRKSQPYIRRLRQRAAGCPQIRFVESPPDEVLRDITAGAYAVLYPPFNEDWGLVPLEAMALGKPVVAVNRGGPSESIIDGVTGLLVEPTVDAFAAAIERLADDPPLVQTMAAAAVSRARQFDWRHFCDGLDSYVEEVVLASRSSRQ